MTDSTALVAKQYMPDELTKLGKGADDAFFEKLRSQITENNDEGEDGDE